MKKFLAIVAIAGFMASCNNDDSTKATTATDSTKVTTDTAVLRLVYQAERFDVTSITSYRKDLAKGVINVAASQFPFEDFYAASGGDTFTQETQLLTKFDGIANGIHAYAGVFPPPAPGLFRCGLF